MFGELRSHTVLQDCITIAKARHLKRYIVTFHFTDRRRALLVLYVKLRNCDAVIFRRFRLYAGIGPPCGVSAISLASKGQICFSNVVFLQIKLVLHCLILLSNACLEVIVCRWVYFILSKAPSTLRMLVLTPLLPAIAFWVIAFIHILICCSGLYYVYRPL